MTERHQACVGSVDAAHLDALLAWRAGRGVSEPAGGDRPTVEATVENIRETFRHIPAKQLAEQVELLANGRSKLFLVGGRFTDPIARYMAAHLTIIRPNVFHLGGQESTWTDRLLDMGKRGVTAPGIKYGIDRVLHGEQYTELARPLPPKAKRRPAIWPSAAQSRKPGPAASVGALDPPRPRRQSDA